MSSQPNKIQESVFSITCYVGDECAHQKTEENCHHSLKYDYKLLGSCKAQINLLQVKDKNPNQKQYWPSLKYRNDVI